MDPLCQGKVTVQCLNNTDIQISTHQIQLKLFLIQGESFLVSSSTHALSWNVIMQYLSISSHVNSYLNGRQLVLFKLEECFNHSLIKFGILGDGLLTQFAFQCRDNPFT